MDRPRSGVLRTRLGRHRECALVSWRLCSGRSHCEHRRQQREHDQEANNHGPPSHRSAAVHPPRVRPPTESSHQGGASWAVESGFVTVGDFQLLVLGPTVVRISGVAVTVRPQEAAVLGVLAVCGRDGATISQLSSGLWTLEPDTARKTVQNHVARVRKALGASAVETTGFRYRLGDRWRVDVDEFASIAQQANACWAVGDFDAQRDLLSAALGILRGEPLESNAGTAIMSAARRRIAAIISNANEGLLGALIETDRLAEAIDRGADLIAMTTPGNEPSERTWLLTAIAVARHGDRREALSILQRARIALREHAGLSRSHALHRLESLLLVDEPAIGRESLRDLISGDVPIASFPKAGQQLFIGRRTETRLVASVLSEARASGKAHIVQITGPPGIGRSAFARRIAMHARAEGWGVGTATCPATPVRPFEPLGPCLVAANEALSNRTSKLDPARTARHGETLSCLTRVAIIGAAAENALAARTVALIGDYADAQPLLLIVDDARRLSQSTARLIARLLDVDAPLVIVLVDPPQMQSQPRALTIRLVGLSAVEVTQLYVAIHNVEPESGLPETIRAATDGNPALVRQLLLEDEQFAAENDQLAKRADLVGRAWRLAVTRLDADGLVATVAIAIAARALQDDQLNEMLEGVVDDRAFTLEELFSRSIIKRDANGLVRMDPAVTEATLRTVNHHTLARLHERWIDILETRPECAMDLATHTTATADHDPERAVAALDRAAEAAAANANFAEAARFLEQSIDTTNRYGLDRLESFGRRLNRCEHLRFALDDRYVDELVTLANEARAFGDFVNATRAAGMLCRLGPGLRSGSLDERIASIVDETIHQCLDLVARSRASGDAALFFCAVDADRCRRLYLASVADARRSADPDTLAYALGFACIALSHPNDWPLRRETAYELFALAEQLDSDTHRFEALYLLFSSQLQYGDPLVRTTERAAAALATSCQIPQFHWMAAELQKAVFHIDNKTDECLALARSIRAQGLMSRSKDDTTYFMQLIAVRFGQGRAAELRVDIRALGHAQPLVLGWVAMAAWVAAGEQDWPAVAEICDRTDCGDTLPHDMSWVGSVYYLARAIGAAADLDRSKRLRNLLQPHTNLMAWSGCCATGPVDLALAELCLTLGELDDARLHIDRARAICTRLFAPVFLPNIDSTAARIASPK